MTPEATIPAVTTYPPGATWAALLAGNPSLESWLRSAATAGAAGLAWWCRWASQTPLLRMEISKAIGHDTPPDVYHQAVAAVRSKISEAYETGRQAAQQAAGTRGSTTPYPTIPPVSGSYSKALWAETVVGPT